MFMSAKHEEFTRASVAEKSNSLYKRIERVLEEARIEVVYPVDVVRRIRTLLRNEYSDLTVVRSFVLKDLDNFRDWSISVEYPDGRVAKITHES